MGFHVIMVPVVVFVALAMQAMASAAVNRPPVTTQSSWARGSH